MHFNKTQIATAVLTALLSTSALADVKIAVLGPFSGGSEGMGVSLRDGVTLAAAEINARGGIMGGQKIILVKYNEEGKPALGAASAKSAVEQENVVAAIGFANTGVAVKAAEVFQKAGIPLIVSTSTGTVLTQSFKNEPVNYIFRMSAPDTLQTKVVVSEVVDNQKARRIAIFADSSAYGQQGLDQVIPLLKAKGIEPVLVERFAPGKTEFDEAAMKARAAKVDAVITWCLAPEAAGIKSSFNRVGLRTPFTGSWTLTLGVYSDNAGLISNGTKSTIIFSADTTRKEGQAFLKNYRQYNNTAVIPSDLAASEAYDGMYLLASALNQAKSTDGKKIVDALENLQAKYEGAIQTYNKPFSHTNHEAITDISQVSIGIVKNGTVVKAK